MHGFYSIHVWPSVAVCSFYICIRAARLQMAMPGLVGNMVGGVIGGGSSAAGGAIGGAVDEAKLRGLNMAVLELSCIFVAGGVFSFVRGYLFTLAGEEIDT